MTGSYCHNKGKRWVHIKETATKIKVNQGVLNLFYAVFFNFNKSQRPPLANIIEQRLENLLAYHLVVHLI